MNLTRQQGFSMMEVLVTIAIVMLGLLGMAGLQTRATLTEMESYQRAQALVLLQEMADRMSANKMDQAAYLASDLGASGALKDCSAGTVAQKDLCEWHNSLLGAAETSADAKSVGAMVGARGCITNPAANIHVITVAWQGLVPTAAPVDQCGLNAYGDDRQRRTVSTVVRKAVLD